MWDKITYPFPNVKGATVEVWEWVSKFIPHFTGHVLAYFFKPGLKLIPVSKGGQGNTSQSCSLKVAHFAIKSNADHIEAEMECRALCRQQFIFAWKKILYFDSSLYSQRSNCLYASIHGVNLNQWWSSFLTHICVPQPRYFIELLFKPRNKK